MMSAPNSWKIQFSQEINKAVSARSLGNEGMARVCSRRAAGIVIGEYFRQRGITEIDPSVYNRLRRLRELPGLDQEVRAVVEHFLLRITPDKLLPIEADLIAEAHWLAKKLLEK